MKPQSSGLENSNVVPFIIPSRTLSRKTIQANFFVIGPAKFYFIQQVGILPRFNQIGLHKPRGSFSATQGFSARKDLGVSIGAARISSLKYFPESIFPRSKNCTTGHSESNPTLNRGKLGQVSEGLNTSSTWSPTFKNPVTEVFIYSINNLSIVAPITKAKPDILPQTSPWLSQTSNSSAPSATTPS